MKTQVRRLVVVYVALLGLFILLAACQPVQRLPANRTTSVRPAESAQEAANKAVVQRFYDEVFTQKKMPVLNEVFAPNLVIHDLDVGGELPGGGLPETLAAFPDVKATVKQWVVEGDLVVASVTYTGTQQAAFLGVAPTGKTVTWNIIDMWRVQDGKIVELWHNIPNDDILEQIQPQASNTMTNTTTAAPTSSKVIPQVTITAKDFAFAMPDEVPAGLVSLTLKNAGQANHHAIIGRMKAGITLDDVMKVLKDPQGDPSTTSDMNFFMPDTDPGTSNQATVALQPGNWVIFSVSMSDPTGQDHTPDWAKGSIKQFKVTGDATAGAPPPHADLVLTIGKDDFAMPSALKAGKQTIEVVNASGKQQGYAFFVKLGDDTTVADILAMFDAFFAGKQPAKMADFHAVGGLMGHDLGQPYYTTIDFAPGNYAVISSINTTDFPYAGLAKTFTVAPMANSSTPSATVTNTSTIPISDTNPTRPNDVTQGRLRISNCVSGGPSVDWLLNGKLTVNGGVTQANLPALDVSGYQYLAPGTYSVAIVPTGEGLDKALLGPLDVKVDAGHRYTLVMLGQLGEQHTPLLIDETKAYQQAGLTAETWGEIAINNVKNAAGVSFIQDGAGVKDVPYGGFATAAMPAGTFKDFKVTISGAGKPDVEANGAGFNLPGSDQLDCFAGVYPNGHDTHTAPTTSLLNPIDFLQVTSDGFAQIGDPELGFTSFLAALKRAGLTEELAQGGPYLIFAPTDAAFAALPKDKREALMADPKALTDLIHTHLIAGYFPVGALGRIGSGFNRTVTNLRGEELKITGNDGGLFINGKPFGATSGTFVANGTRVMSVQKLLLPDTVGAIAPPAQPAAAAPSIPTSSATVQFIGHTGRVVQAAFSPDGKTVLTGSEDGTARLWDAATGKELRRFIGHTDELRGAIFSPDGKTIFTTSNDRTARLWDVATGKELRQFIGHTDQVNKAAFSPDGKLVVTASPDGTARVWEVSTAKSLLTFTGHAPSSPNRPAFAPDGKAIATGGLDGTVLLWEPLTGAIQKTFKGPTGGVGTPAFSPDGKYLVTPGADGTARLWDIASGKELRRFEVPAQVQGADFSPDGKYLVTSGADHMARLWDVQSGKELRRFIGHTDEVRTVVFSPDGKAILTASHDGTARLWRID